MDSGNEADLHYACIADLDLNHFSTGVFGVDAPEQQETTEKQSDTTYQVQTTRLYHIAESFVRQVQDLLQGTDAQGADGDKTVKAGILLRDRRESPDQDGMSKLALIIFGQEQIGFALVA